MSVQAVFEEFSAASDQLAKLGEVSLELTLKKNAAKLVLLGAASEFEVALCEVVRDFVRLSANNDDRIASLVEKKAISRQYHTWFDWNKPTANPFFSLFGSEFSDSMKKLIKEDDKFSASVSSFLEIGQLRNSLVHNNFSTFYMEKTAEEIHNSYLIGAGFIEVIRHHLMPPDDLTAAS